MFIPDMPNIPPQDVPVMIAQANQAQPNNVATTRTLGICFPVPNMPDAPPSADNILSPILAAKAYFREFEHKAVTSSATVGILQPPKHGTLVLGEGGDGVYAYLPEPGYLGKDSATVLVEFGGTKVKVVYFFQAIEGPLGNTGWEELCSETGLRWKISSTLDADGNSTVASVEYQSAIIDTGAATTDTAAQASTLSTSILSVDPSSVTFNLADLDGSAVGQTVGTNITLDTNTAGHNWFIDTTP